MLINILNLNTEKEQVRVFNELTTTISNLDNIDNYIVIFTGDVNVGFEALLDAKSGTRTLRRQSINKLIYCMEL